MIDITSSSAIHDRITYGATRKTVKTWQARAAYEYASYLEDDLSYGDNREMSQDYLLAYAKYCNRYHKSARSNVPELEIDYFVDVAAFETTVGKRSVSVPASVLLLFKMGGMQYKVIAENKRAAYAKMHSFYRSVVHGGNKTSHNTWVIEPAGMCRFNVKLVVKGK